MDGTLVSREDMTLPATLTLWPNLIDAKAVEPRELASLGEALALARRALRDGSGTPWILTESGTILTPAYLRAVLAGEGIG